VAPPPGIKLEGNEGGGGTITLQALNSRGTEVEEEMRPLLTSNLR